MKKTFLKSAMTTIIIVAFMCSSIISMAALAEPDDFKMLDNFDGYADTQAALDAGYLIYDYGNVSTTFEIVTDGAKSGKALKLTNAEAAERLDFVKAFTMASGADGISFWFNNTSDIEVAIGPMVNYNAIEVGENYFAKADGASTFVETTPTGNQWFPIVVPAGTKVEIAIPFSSFQTLYEWTDPTVIIQVWGATSLYGVVVDNFQLYGVDDPDPIETSTESSTESSSESMSDDTETQSPGDNGFIMLVVSLVILSSLTVMTAIKRKQSFN